MTNIVELGNYSKFTDLTDDIQFVPNKWSRLTEMGLFTPRGTPNLSVTMDRVDNQLTVLNSMARGSAPQYGKNEIVKTYSYATAFYAVNDKVAPEDIQGRRRPGSADQADMVEEAVARKLSNLRRAHAQTKEYMMMQALKGSVKSPNATVFADLYTDFGFAQKTVDFLLGTATTDVDAKIREVVRHIEDNVYSGAGVGGIHILVDSAFFDKLISHANVREAYTYYQAANQVGGGQVLRDDLRRAFKHQGVTFEEYRASVTLMDGSTETFIESTAGYAFPLGVDDMFEIWYSPAHHMNYVNTIGEEVYAWSIPAQDGSGIEIMSQSSPLPLCRRPQALVKVFSSN